MKVNVTKFVPRQFLYDAPNVRLSHISRAVGARDWVQVNVVVDSDKDAKVFKSYTKNEER